MHGEITGGGVHHGVGARLRRQRQPEIGIVHVHRPVGGAVTRERSGEDVEQDVERLRRQIGSVQVAGGTQLGDGVGASARLAPGEFIGPDPAGQRIGEAADGPAGRVVAAFAQRHGHDDGIGGWGLPLVQALSSGCGVRDTEPHGKWVWAKVAT